MHFATLAAPLELPSFRPKVEAPRPVASLWQVTLRPLGRPHPWAWRGWADNSEAAKRACVGDARHVWPGHSFVVLSVLQVNV